MRNQSQRRGVVGAALLLVGACCAAGHAASVRPFGADRVVEVDVRYDVPSSTYTLRTVGADAIAYTVDLDDPDVAAGMLRVSVSLGGRAPITVLAKAGTRYRSAADVLLEPEAVALTAGAQLIEHGIEGDALVLRYRERPGSHRLEKIYRLSLEGISLVVEFSSDSTRGLDGYAGVSLGRAENAPGTRVVHLPYLPEPVALFPGGEVMTAYVDPMASSSVSITTATGVDEDGSVFAHGRTLAEPDTAGMAVPLSETAYVTVSDSLLEVLPRVVGPESPYREALSQRLVLDVWGLHRSFSWREGVALSWSSSETGNAHLTVRYADGNPSCGDGVAIIIRHNDRILDRLVVRNGDTSQKSWQRDIILARDDTIRTEIDRDGNNSCDGTYLTVSVDTPADLFRSQADFSSTQGHRGFSYLEYVGYTDTPMTWDPATERWVGAGDYSLLWRDGGHPGRSTSGAVDARAMVERYVEYGLTELAIIFHVWQRWGYDEGLPDHYPAHPDLGSSAEVAAFVAAARDAGMLVSFHENYTDMYPHDPPEYPSPLWDASAIALDRRGDRKLGWYQPHTEQQAFRIAADRMRDLAAAESSVMATDYGPNSAYLDVTTGYRADWSVDHRAASQGEHSLAYATRAVLELFETMKQTHGGPLLGEGGAGSRRFDSYFAGFVDAVERQIDQRSRAQVIPLYELAAVKPRMFNHGMGYYSRYFPDAGQVTPTLEQADLDQYRASEIAFGHAGFLGGSIAGVRNWMRLHAPEYWLMLALQSRYADAEITDVAYFDGARFLDTEEALRARLPLASARVRLTYANGLVVHVNRDSPARLASSSGDFSQEQGQGGWGYVEDSGAGLVPLSWDQVRHRWQGSRAYLILHAFGGHPDGGAAVRTFAVPTSARLRIEGSVEDADLSCGDGVLARITREGELVWECSLPGDIASPCEPFDFELDAKAGDVIAFRIEQKATKLCDSTLFTATVSWDDEASHDWTIAGPSGPRTLAPSGFFAHDALGLTAFTARLDGDSQAPVVDYVAWPGYHFARSRDGRSREIEEFVTDGGIAVVHRALGDELHGLGLTVASSGERLLLRSTARADINVRLLDGRRALVQIRDLETGATADVTWGALPFHWREALEARRGDLELVLADSSGDPQGDALPVTYDAGGNLVLAGLVDGGSYLIRLVAGTTPFIRGDGNDDGSVDISDAVHTLNWLFGGGPPAGCLAATNVNDDDAVNIADPTYLLNHLFAGGPAPGPPFPDCGPSSEDEALRCETPPRSCQ